MNEIELLSSLDLIEIGELMGMSINVVAKDMLKYSKKRYNGYIINLDNSYNTGTHWVALYIDDMNACYFDPFGEECPLSVYKFCKGKTLITSNYVIQNLNQQVCGYYCLAFLHYMNFNKNKNIRYKLNNFIKPFDLDDTTKNDDILQQYLKNIKI